MNNRFFDLAWNRQADGTIRLTQTDCGDSYIVDAHPEQILFIARQMCGMKHDNAAHLAELERKLSVLTDRLQDIICNSQFRESILEGSRDGLFYIAKLDGLLDMALEFDGGRLEPEYAPGPQKQPTANANTLSKGNPSHFNVTSDSSEQLGLEV